MQDPWQQPYIAEFSVNGSNLVMTLRSSGPDKRPDTIDDFVAGTFTRPYFTPLQHIIREILKRQEDYPSTDADFLRLLTDNGLILSSLHDPWGTGYRSTVTTYGSRRIITILSAGSDKVFGTVDDVSPANFFGTYFRKETSEILKAIETASQAPQTVDEFLAVLAGAGIDPARRYRDAWGPLLSHHRTDLPPAMPTASTPKQFRSSELRRQPEQN